MKIAGGMDTWVVKLGKAVAMLVCAAAFGPGLRAGDAAGAEKRLKELEKIIEDQGIHLETAKVGVRLGGWVDASYSYNFNGGATDSGVNGTPVTSPLDVLDSQDFSVNSARLILEKPLPEENTWAAGFSLEIVFGEDTKIGFDNDPGLELFEFANVFFRVPVGNGLDVTVGKWMALLGYEYTDRVKNDNFTYGALTWFLEPGTHTGILFTYPINDLVTANLGVGNGWNNSDTDFLDNNENGDDGPSDWAKVVTGSLEIANPGGNAELILGAAYSPEGEAYYGNVSSGTIDGSDTATENAGLLALNANGVWTPKFGNEKLQLGFNADMVASMDNLHRTSGTPPYDRDANSATAWGLGLYSRYQVSEILYLAGRAEYLHSDDGTLGIVDGLVADGGAASIDRNEVFVSHTDLWTYTLTAGFDLAEGFRVRLEYRLDAISSDGGGDGEANFFDNNQSTQHAFSIDASYAF